MPLQVRILACLGGSANAPIYAVEFPEGDLCTLKLGDHARVQDELAWREAARHPAVPRALACYHRDGAHALALPAIDGATVGTLARGAPLPARVAVAVAATLGEALFSAPPLLSTGHISPEDVAVTARGEVVVLDPGSGEAISNPADPRALSYRLGALLFALVKGAALPRRTSLELPWERAARLALERADVAPEAASLIRRLVAWSPTRRPRPEAAIPALRALAASLPGPSLAAWAADAAGARIPSPETGACWTLDDEADDALPHEPAGDPFLRFAVGEDQEMLFFPDGGAEAEPDSPVDPTEPVASDHADAGSFDLEDQASVTPFPPLFAAAQEDPVEEPIEDDATDPERFSPVSAEDNTDPEPLTLPQAGLLACEEEAEEPTPDEATPGPLASTSAVGPAATARSSGPWIVLGIAAVLAAVAGYAAAG